MAHYNGTLQRHPATSTVHSPKVGRHPPCPHHTTLQWHPAMAPGNRTTSTPQIWSSPSPRNDSAAMAPSNGTTSTPPKLVAPNHSTLQWHPTMAQQGHHVLCTLQWHTGATSNPPKWFVALPPIGSKNPNSYRYLGNNHSLTGHCRPVVWQPNFWYALSFFSVWKDSCPLLSWRFGKPFGSDTCQHNPDRIIHSTNAAQRLKSSKCGWLNVHLNCVPDWLPQLWWELQKACGTANKDPKKLHEAMNDFLTWI